MIIYVSAELEYIKTELLNRGYNVIENNNTICDVIICNLKNDGLLSLNLQNNTRREGTLIIDAGSKTVEQIEYILNNRVYSSLFY
jgi:hypothetical protein